MEEQQLVNNANQPQYDKPRIASTIVIGIFTLIALIITIVTLPINWEMVKEAVDNTAENSDNAAGAVAGGFVIALFGALAVVLTIVLNIANIINQSICLPFALKNRRSTLKPVRIISYVFDGLTGAILLTNIVKIIYLIITSQS